MFTNTKTYGVPYSYKEQTALAKLTLKKESKEKKNEIN